MVDLASLTVALDGDDTLWHNEAIFQKTQRWYEDLLTDHGVSRDLIHDALIATERRNLSLYGYGIKGFTLSCLETAVALTDQSLPAESVLAIIDRCRAMLEESPTPIDGVVEALTFLGPRVDQLLLITKGDLLDQERKVAGSGLTDHFADVHIVSEKDPATYRNLVSRYRIDPSRFVMVGNSIRSDVLPVVEIGGHAVHIPYHITWEIETVAPSDIGSDASAAFVTLDSIAELPGALNRL